MPHPHLNFPGWSAARITLALLLLALPIGTVPASSSSADNASFAVVQNETATQVENVTDRPKKALGQTVYLCSAVETAPRPAQTTPAPKHQTSAPVKAMTPAISAPITVSKHPGNASKGNSGKACTPDDDEVDDYKNITSIPDPIQPLNRGFFWFNHQLYHYAFHPLCRAYKAVLPSPVRTGVYNVFDNLEYPVRFVNDLLQWQPKRAGLETEKFLVNTTAGVAGIFKPSDKVSWLKDVPKTDTGVTFAKWGIPHGCYIVWPVLGPKSLRDSVGFAGDLALYPVTWVTYGAVGGLTGASTLAVSGPDAARTTSDKMDTYDTLTHDSVDRYLAVRSAYEQNRKQAEKK